MCREEDKKKQGECKHPEKLKGKPGECSPEQIKECHGHEASHPCEPAEDCLKPEEKKGRKGPCSPEQIRKCHGEGAGHPCSKPAEKKE